MTSLKGSVALDGDVGPGSSSLKASGFRDIGGLQCMLKVHTEATESSSSSLTRLLLLELTLYSC